MHKAVELKQALHVFYFEESKPENTKALNPQNYSTSHPKTLNPSPKALTPKAHLSSPFEDRKGQGKMTWNELPSDEVLP